MKKSFVFILTLVLLIIPACDEFDELKRTNPIDPKSENYRGYRAIDKDGDGYPDYTIFGEIGIVHNDWTNKNFYATNVYTTDHSNQDGLSYAWDFEADGRFDTPSLKDANKTASKVYPGLGSYTVVLKISDDNMNILLISNSFICTNSMPSAQFIVNHINKLQKEFVVKDAHDPDKHSTLEFAWDFDGDGNLDTGFSVGTNETHSYTNEGTKTARVYVRDEYLTNSWSANVDCTDTPGSVSITNVTNAQVFSLSNEYTIFAEASDADGISKVQFFANGSLISEDSSAPYSASWTPQSLGGATLSATLVDSGAKSYNSSSLSVRVTNLFAGLRREYTVSGVSFAVRYCPPGTFMMGSPSSEPDRESDETQHEVTLTEGFWMMETEVTQELYEAVMGNNPSHSYGVGNNYPVYYVDWYDSTNFAGRLSDLTGLDFRLPTEAQWEYAARAGTRTAYYWGDDSSESIVKQYAWYRNNARSDYWTTPHADNSGTQPVGTKLANAWGLYDMSGNVWEWCSDWYGSSYYSSSPSVDPTGPSSGAERVVRGGCWGNDAQYCRSASRNSLNPVSTSGGYGFRLLAAE